MVLATLNLIKSMTRRLRDLNKVNEHPDNWEFVRMHTGVAKFWEKDNATNEIYIKCPYGKPGDLLVIASYIPGYPKTYCAGYNGVIYSKARGEWKPLKSFIGQKGYQSVTLMIDGKKTTRNVHTLVCLAFCGNPSSKSMQVRHLDGIPDNNCAGNLKWGTQEENWQDRKAHGNGIEGEKHHDSIFTDEERKHISWAVEKGLCSLRHAAKILGVSYSAVYGICNQDRVIEPTKDFVPCARIWLEVTDIGVERLQDITEDDAIKEGIEDLTFGSKISFKDYLNRGHPLNATASFKSLWQKLNGSESWETNPWVWVISFKVLSTTGNRPTSMSESNLNKV